MLDCSRRKKVERNVDELPRTVALGAKASTNVVAALGLTPKQAEVVQLVLLGYSDGQIAERLAQPEIYYIGHLLGETTGFEGNVYSVTFTDLGAIRAATGQTANEGSIADINKDGTISFTDIGLAHGSIGIQLTNITIPASGVSGIDLFQPRNSTSSASINLQYLSGLQVSGDVGLTVDVERDEIGDLGLGLGGV